MLLPWLTLLDFKGVFANFRKARRLDYRHKNDDFVILIPIFNDVKYLSNIEFLKKYSGKVVLCTTNIETEKFYNDLEKIARENNFEVIKTEFRKDVKNPWKIYQKTLLAHDYVLGEAIKILNAKYVIFLDADTTCRTDLRYLIGMMERDDIDLASVKVLPSRKKTITENLQYIEYEVAMKSRRIYPWLTSGAAMAAKRESMKKIMEKHSLFFNGGDIEIGKIAHLMGMKVEHIPVRFYTDVPETYPKLVKQRFSWFCGAFRHSVINAHTNLFSPIYSLYFTLIIFFMLPMKIHELFSHWFILPFIFLFYTLMNVIANWDIKNKYILLFPLYSLVQVLLFPILGIYRYIKTVIKTRNTGFIRVFYKHKYHPLRYAFNITLIMLIAFFLLNTNLVEGKLMLKNIDLLKIVGVDFTTRTVPAIIYNGTKLFIIMTGIFFTIFGTMKIINYLRHLNKKRRKYYKVLKEKAYDLATTLTSVLKN
ncbi:MAG: glycosyltransferase family 2 protein [Candidatus Nanoarchaeia archaeon]